MAAPTQWIPDAEGCLRAVIDGTLYRIFESPAHGTRAAYFSVETGDLRHGWNRLGVAVGSLDTAMAEAEEHAVHLRQLATLDRRDAYELDGKRSPWGTIQGATRYAPGVVSVHTAGHGGFKLDAARNRAMPAALRIPGGAYEEDAEWARVALGFPELFTGREVRMAERTLREWSPEVWEAHTGRTLQPGQSHARDEAVFHDEHRDSWLVVSAIMNRDQPGIVDCTAILGGRHGAARGEAVETRTFLVPEAEYATRRFAFVVDPDRHPEKDAAPAPGM